MNLKQKTAKGILWAFIDQLGVKFAVIAVHLILSWWILPTFMGVLFAVTALLQILSVIADGGFGAALVQKKEINRTDISTVFYFNMVVSTLLFAGIWISSPFIADYFEDARLAPVLPVLALGIVISSCGQTQSLMMAKKLMFKQLTWISLPATIAGGIVGIALAIAGMNVWALVFQKIATLGVRSIMLWRRCPAELQPNFKFSWHSLSRLTGLSLGLLGSNLIMRITRNLIELIIQKNFGAIDLSYYSQARFFQKAPTEPLLMVLNRVLFPVFSEIQDDNKKIKSSLQTGIPILMFFVAPLMFFMMASAESLIPVSIGANWMPAIPYLQIVPLIGITFSLSAIKSNVIRSKGDGGVIFLLSLFRNGLSITTLCFTWKYGIMAMIIGQIICYCINMTVNDFFTWRYIKYRVAEQWLDWMPTVFAAAIGAVIVYGLGKFVPGGPYVVLPAQMLGFVGCYLAIAAFFRLPGFLFARQQANKYLFSPGQTATGEI